MKFTLSSFSPQFVSVHDSFGALPFSVPCDLIFELEVSSSCSEGLTQWKIPQRLLKKQRGYGTVKEGVCGDWEWMTSKSG